MKLLYSLILFISIFLVSGCSFNQIALGPDNGKNYTVSYDDSIPESLKEIIDMSFRHSSTKDENKTRIFIKDFNSTNYNIYAGSSLRSLEGEVTASIKLEIISNSKTNNKNIKVMKRYNSSELNPYAEQEAIRSLKEIIDNEIFNQILLEVNFFEMWISFSREISRKISKYFFIYGSEVVLRNNSKDLIKKYLSQKGFNERRLITKENFDQIEQIIIESSGGSLFGSKLIIDISHDQGRLPDKLEKIFQIENIFNNENITIIINSHNEKLNTKTKLYKAMEKMHLLLNVEN